MRFKLICNYVAQLYVHKIYNCYFICFTFSALTTLLGCCLLPLCELYVTFVFFFFVLSLLLVSFFLFARFGFRFGCCCCLTGYVILLGCVFLCLVFDLPKTFSSLCISLSFLVCLCGATGDKLHKPQMYLTEM